MVQDNNLSHNGSKTKELVTDFTKWCGVYDSVSINGAKVEMGESFNSLVEIATAICGGPTTWTIHTMTVW